MRMNTKKVNLYNIILISLLVNNINNCNSIVEYHQPEKMLSLGVLNQEYQNNNSKNKKKIKQFIKVNKINNNNNNI